MLSSPALSVIAVGAAGVAVVHTLAGPDHYLPFIVMARARRWSLARTAGWTLVCGLGHVGSSVILGLGGVMLGYGLEHVQIVEGIRGNLAAWAMIAFGLVYLAWGLKRAARRHADHSGHSHGDSDGFRLTPWILFTIFVFGPCEPMIPLVMYPAMRGSWLDVWTVVTVFSVLTLASMLAVVLLTVKGTGYLPTRALERFNHAIAGGTILLAGCAIQFLGL